MPRILKADLRMSKASARWVPRLLSEDDCGHNPASYNGILSDVIDNLDGVLQNLISFVQNLHVNVEIMKNNSQVKSDCNRPYSFPVIYKASLRLSRPTS